MRCNYESAGINLINQRITEYENQLKYLLIGKFKFDEEEINKILNGDYKTLSDNEKKIFNKFVINAFIQRTSHWELELRRKVLNQYSEQIKIIYEELMNPEYPSTPVNTILAETINRFEDYDGSFVHRYEVNDRISDCLILKRVFEVYHFMDIQNKKIDESYKLYADQWTTRPQILIESSLDKFILLLRYYNSFLSYLEKREYHYLNDIGVPLLIVKISDCLININTQCMLNKTEPKVIALWKSKFTILREKIDSFSQLNKRPNHAEGLFYLIMIYVLRLFKYHEFKDAKSIASNIRGAIELDIQLGLFFKNLIIGTL